MRTTLNLDEDVAAHLAAVAIEWGLDLLVADRDFARYDGLR